MPGESDSTKPVPMQVRLDPELHARVKNLADRTEISVNQLVQGVLRWAVENAVVGEPNIRPGGHVKTRDVPGCVYFGETGSEYDDPESGERLLGSPGRVFFGLDFSGRGLVRWDHHPAPPQSN